MKIFAHIGYTLYGIYAGLRFLAPGLIGVTFEAERRREQPRRTSKEK